MHVNLKFVAIQTGKKNQKKTKLIILRICLFCLSLLEATLKYATSMSKSLESLKQETTIKFLRVLLHKVYNIVEKVYVHTVSILLLSSFVRSFLIKY